MTFAAERGFPPALVGLGILAQRAGATNPGAADWFEKAAAAGDPQGQFLYAVALSEGDGRPKDIAGALQWVDRALAAGDALDPQLRADAQSLRARLAGEAAKPALRP